MTAELRESILEILAEHGAMEPADIRDELDAEPSKQLTHHHLQAALDAGEVEKPYTGVYRLAHDGGDGDE